MKQIKRKVTPSLPVLLTSVSHLGDSHSYLGLI